MRDAGAAHQRLIFWSVGLFADLFVLFVKLAGEL